MIGPKLHNGFDAQDTLSDASEAASFDGNMTNTPGDTSPRGLSPATNSDSQGVIQPANTLASPLTNLSAAGTNSMDVAALQQPIPPVTKDGAADLNPIINPTGNNVDGPKVDNVVPTQSQAVTDNPATTTGSQPLSMAGGDSGALTSNAATTTTLAYPYNDVCYITDSFGQGSGVIIGPHTILTASHVLWDADVGHGASNIQIYPGYQQGGTSITGSWIDHYYQVADNNHSEDKFNAQFDFAVIDVAQDLWQYGNFGVITNEGSTNVHLTGYPGTANGQQVDQTGGVTLDSSYSVFDYGGNGQVASIPGDSGGPLWIYQNNLPYVVGVADTTGYGAQLTSSDWTTIQGWINSDAGLWADDYAANNTTTGHVSVNSSTTGRIENHADRDWFAVQLTAGQSYRINVDGTGDGSGTLDDTYLRLYNGSSQLITLNDDSGPGSDSQLYFTPTTSGTYYVEASGYADSHTGTYTVRVTADDYADDTSTAGQVTNGVAHGNLEVTGDHDWFAVQLTAGHNYIIDERGSPSGGGNLSDSYVRLHNAGGTEIAHDDDSGVGLDSQLAVHVSNSGTYYVDAGAYGNSYTGTYTIGVQDLGTAMTRFETPDFSAAQWGNNQGWTSEHQFPRELADINGDGLADIVGFGNDGVYVSLATGNGHFAPLSFALSANFGAQFGWTSDDQFPRALADVNGDGMADIVGFGNDGVYVSLATGNGHFAPSSFALGSFGAQLGWVSDDQFPRTLADVNGDGMADVVGFGNDGVYVSLATGNGHFASPTFSLNSYGNQMGWLTENQFPRELADVNGDGKADIVGFGNDGVYVSLATGNGHFAAPTFAISHYFGAQFGWTSDNQFPRELADVNGDGMADIVGFATSGVYVALATGNGHFATPTSDLAAYGTNFGWATQDQFPRELADVTGDHRADIVAFGNDGTYVSASHDFLVV